MGGERCEGRISDGAAVGDVYNFDIQPWPTAGVQNPSQRNHSPLSEMHRLPSWDPFSVDHSSVGRDVSDGPTARLDSVGLRATFTIQASRETDVAPGSAHREGGEEREEKEREGEKEREREREEGGES